MAYSLLVTRKTVDRFKSANQRSVDFRFCFERRAKLPVDAFYPELNLVVEYRERQHTEPVTFWDTKLTACGLQRGEQRKQYDEMRRVVLKARGYHLVEVDFFDLAHDARKRLIEIFRRTRSL
jgi:hypothetical protein